MHAINDGHDARGVEGGDQLLAFADAIVADDDAELRRTREDVVVSLGVRAMVDAAGVASNFERMVRIADATGIPLGDRLAAFSSDVRSTLSLERFLTNKDRG